MKPTNMMQLILENFSSSVLFKDWPPGGLVTHKKTNIQKYFEILESFLNGDSVIVTNRVKLELISPLRSADDSHKLHG